ncbi:MAG: 2-polyprenyl-6-methoxyphenol hydroxylase-like oxidoreductase [Chloroflexi bacterium]|nr:2-polyprenyl-6-methoxyphenol hydroxylase-like oxidoreductase [Chloroflexota bacterium]
MKPITPMAGDAGRRAIVIGGSMAGLWTARVLADHFDYVTVLERDQLPEGPEHRPGAPQSRHVHVLLARGLALLEELFPGIGQELAAAGATSFDWGADTKSWMRGRWLQRTPFGIGGVSCSRPLLETAMRRRLAAYPNVHFAAGVEVTGLLAGAHNRRVIGVTLRPRFRVPANVRVQDRLLADWVVDASGRHSQAPAWLAALGYDAPQETVVNPFLGYATRRYEKAPGSPADWRVMYRFIHPPDDPRAGVIFQEEDGHWTVTLMGAARDYPPADEAGFRAFARSLAPEFYAAIESARPLTSIAGYRATENRLRHYERLGRWPDNFVVLGDAVCAFNPIYGQGMTVSALSALALGQALSRTGGNRAGIARRFQKQLARKVIGPVWQMATSEDFRLPQTAGERPGWPTRALHWYFDQLMQVMPDSPTVTRVFVEVFQLLKPGTALFRPAILARAFGRSLRWSRPASRQRSGRSLAVVAGDFQERS